MMLSLLLVAGLAPASTIEAAPAAPVAVVAPQDFPASKGSSSPSGGTPAPLPVLLLVGSALGYGAYRLKRAMNKDSQER